MVSVASQVFIITVIESRKRGNSEFLVIREENKDPFRLPSAALPPPAWVQILKMLPRYAGKLASISETEEGSPKAPT